MDSRTGKKIRMGRLFNQRSGRSLIVAYSHGILMGPRPGMKTMEDMRHLTQRVISADALMVAPGMLSHLEDAFVGRDHPSLVIHLDYQSFSRDILPYREGATVEPRSARERTNAEDKTTPELLAMYCRISAEIGADIVKCIYPGNVQALRTVVEGCPAPLLVAGGARAEKPEDAYRQAQGAMEAGAAGLVFGRNIYESNEPAAELARYRRIVHGEQMLHNFHNTSR